MKKRLLSLLLLFFSFSGFSQTNLVIDPGSRYQTMEGWGVSLAWWANVAGGWSDAKIDTLCTWLTSPMGLNMNIFRFNIAGEENPAHNHFRYSAQLQGYKVSETGSYDFTRDATQRKILVKLKAKRSDCIFEAIAYSPPYWMTNSGCTSGNTDGTDNLKTGYFDDFADYLTTVVKYYHDSLGVTFRTLGPVNEPSSGWWLANGPQAGCHYSTTNLVNIVNEVYSKLQSKNMLSYCTVSAMDASNGGETLTELNAIVSNNIISKISQVNTHSYSQISTTTEYQQLYDSAKKHAKKLWQSESGPLNLGSGIPGDGFANNLAMTDALLRDMRNLKPVAWCDWQYGDLGNTWSHIQYDSNATFAKIPNFYNRMQVSRFIKPGYTIINSSETNSLAAINSSNDTIALVINNSSLADKSYTINLNLLASTGGTAQVYRTSTGMDGAHWYGSNYKVYTYQAITGLTNGTYTAKAWVKSGGGQTQCYFEAKNFGGSALAANIPRSVEWTQVTISNINVSNGQCTIGFYTNGSKNNWCEFDDVELRLNSAPTTNYVTNYNFENTNAFSQTIPNWSTADTSGADFIQSISHSNNEECAKLSDITISNNILSFTANKKSISTLLIPVTLAATNPLTSGNYRITVKHSNKDMTVAGWSSANDAIIEQWDSVGQSNQVFNVQWTSTGYKLLPSYNAKAVTVNGNSHSNGAVINQYTDLEQSNQRFSIIDVGGGYYKIVARHSSKCLAVNNNGTANGDDIVQWEWLNYDNFKWKFTSVPLSSPLANGTYTIKAKHSNKVMSIAGESSSNGAIVEQWANVCQDNEKFSVQFSSSGYKIKPVYNNKLVSINNYSVANGAAIVQWDDLSQSHQFYEIADIGGGYYKIISRYTDKCLAVNNSGTNNGDDLVQWEWLDYDNFKWAFESPCASRSAPGVVKADIENVIENKLRNLRVYPNPSDGYVTIEYPGIDNGQIQIYDMSGKLRMTKMGGLNNILTINVGRYLAKGMYMLKITGTNKSIVKKIIVQ